MNSSRTWTILFWVFVVGALIWEAHDYNAKIVANAAAHAHQQHFFYNSGTAPVVPPAPVVHEGAYVIQEHYSVQPNTPAGFFTSHITVRNIGTARAVGVQVQIKPYRGGVMDAGDGGDRGRFVHADDPMAQVGQWVSMPDLAPGESASKTVAFLERTSTPAGNNPDPEIRYSTDKAKP